MCSSQVARAVHAVLMSVALCCCDSTGGSSCTVWPPMLKVALPFGWLRLVASVACCTFVCRWVVLVSPLSAPFVRNAHKVACPSANIAANRHRESAGYSACSYSFTHPPTYLPTCYACIPVSCDVDQSTTTSYLGLRSFYGAPIPTKSARMFRQSVCRAFLEQTYACVLTAVHVRALSLSRCRDGVYRVCYRLHRLTYQSPTTRAVYRPRALNLKLVGR